MHNKKNYGRFRRKKLLFRRRRLRLPCCILPALSVSAALLSGCGSGSAVPADSVDGISRVEDISSEIPEAEQAEQTGQNIYWTLPVEDYEISLRDGGGEGVLELLLHRNGEAQLIETYFSGTDDLRSPEDIAAELFEDVMGHNGFCIHVRHSVGSSLYSKASDYYAAEDELIHLASWWTFGLSGESEGVWQRDLDGDGISEIICNLLWMDGGEDTIIYRYDGEKVWEGYGTDLLKEEYEYYGVGSVRAKYLPEQNQVHICYYRPEKEDYEEIDYEINLEQMEWYEFH